MSKKTFSFISLGCAKNLVDSEEIIGGLQKQGYRLNTEIDGSAFVIINTCAFLESARLEALKTIKEMGKIKSSKDSQLEKIIVLGCIAQYYDEREMKERVPEVDLVVPISKNHTIPLLVEKMFFPKKDLKGYTLQKNRFLSRPPHSVYIKISDGCNNKCSYCLIPSLRGRLRSKSIEDILDEVRAVQKLGAKEINLIAQDTTAYGLDLYGKYMIVTLLERLCAVKGFEWIRLLYTHPAHITDDLLKTIQQEPRICNYVDLPIQHISNKILRLMGRNTSKEEIIALYGKMRESIPGIVLRTTVMVGYPGEGDQEFDELLCFLDKYPFERLGAFSFSAEKGTAAFEQDQKVDLETSSQRLKKVMEKQKSISRNCNRCLLGKEERVLIDSFAHNRKKAYGRLSSQAPEVDGRVIINHISGVSPGDFLQVKITGTGSYDLIGRSLKQTRKV
ncbi:MAG: 30S ribosomal protein S12 methylthiotransferase RimO [Bacillota bacterium]|nr:30S ribosomal protein S12 methylthiotransferase RimO [Bacillota bacterium]